MSTTSSIKRIGKFEQFASYHFLSIDEMSFRLKHSVPQLNDFSNSLKKLFLLISFVRVNIFHNVTPRVPMSVYKKKSAHSVQPFGRLQGTYIRMSCFII